MTTAETPVDAKAGWSPRCRAGDHKTCQTARYRCSCDCHGKQGQTPPTAAPTTSTTRRTPMEPAPLAAVPDPPKVEAVTMHTCEVCGRTFANGAGLGGHMKIHGAHRPAASSNDDDERRARDRERKRRQRERGGDGAPTRPAAPKPTAAAPGVILVVASFDNGEAALHSATFTSDGDATRAEALLTALGHTPHRIPVPEN